MFRPTTISKLKVQPQRKKEKFSFENLFKSSLKLTSSLEANAEVESDEREQTAYKQLSHVQGADEVV